MTKNPPRIVLLQPQTSFHRRDGWMRTDLPGKRAWNSGGLASFVEAQHQRAISYKDLLGAIGVQGKPEGNPPPTLSELKWARPCLSGPTGQCQMGRRQSHHQLIDTYTDLDFDLNHMRLVVGNE